MKKKYTRTRRGVFTFWDSGRYLSIVRDKVGREREVAYLIITARAER